MVRGDIYETGDLPVIEIANGVSASFCWARGELLEHLHMTSQAEYPQEQLTSQTPSPRAATQAHLESNCL